MIFYMATSFSGQDVAAAVLRRCVPAAIPTSRPWPPSLQMGKVSEDRFNVDWRAPLSAMQVQQLWVAFRVGVGQGQT